jgi:putative PIG3 family NAD(P)H quinone oxidoreductase
MNGFSWAIDVPAPGGVEALMRTRRPTPQPRPGELLIRVFAAGVNRGDIKQRVGDFPDIPVEASSVLGLEVAGVVEECGDGVTGWKPGDRVCALLAGGGYAEYCVAPVEQCLPMPRGLDFVQAAAIPETFAIVWLLLFEQARLRSGETLLVHGGSSGIGTTAIQVASTNGVRVWATAGTPEKCQLCETLGAAAAINYRTEDFVERLLHYTRGRGVDVVMDMVGGPYAARNIAVLAHGGRLAYVAGDSGAEAAFNIRQIMMRRLTITGATLRHRTVAEKGAVMKTLRERVWPLLESGAIKPVVGRVFAFEEVRAAHRYLESGAGVGKVILRVRAGAHPGREEKRLSA